MNGTWFPGSSGEMAPRGPQFVVSCFEMDCAAEGDEVALKRSASELPSSGWMEALVSLSLNALAWS